MEQEVQEKLEMLKQLQLENEDLRTRSRVLETAVNSSQETLDVLKRLEAMHVADVEQQGAASPSASHSNAPCSSHGGASRSISNGHHDESSRASDANHVSKGSQAPSLFGSLDDDEDCTEDASSGGDSDGAKGSRQRMYELAQVGRIVVRQDSQAVDDSHLAKAGAVSTWEEAMAFYKKFIDDVGALLIQADGPHAGEWCRR